MPLVVMLLAEIGIHPDRKQAGFGDCTSVVWQ